jgi:hypothetical protein
MAGFDGKPVTKIVPLTSVPLMKKAIAKKFNLSKEDVPKLMFFLHDGVDDIDLDDDTDITRCDPTKVKIVVRASDDNDGDDTDGSQGVHPAGPAKRRVATVGSSTSPKPPSRPDLHPPQTKKKSAITKGCRSLGSRLI